MKILFIGNRANVYKKLLLKPNYQIVGAFIEKDSYLAREIEATDHKIILFENSKSEKKRIIELISNIDFDLLVSNGNPFIIPISKIKHENQLFINTHPTYLPHLKGNTPLNGVFYLNYNYIGATTHFMDDGIDTGNIIYQKKIDLTKDIDLGLVYYLSFYLEGEVFEKALNILEKTNYKYLGIPQKSNEGNYFNRETKLFEFNIADESTSNIIRKIRSVGMISQGINITIQNIQYKIFEAEEIVNPYMKSLFENSKSGSLLLKYNNKIIIKTSDGIVKLSIVQ